jgi:hypothetical protein
MAYPPFILHGLRSKRRAQVFVRCRGNVFTESFPDKDRTDGLKGFMSYAGDMVSDATMCDVPSFIKIGSGTQKLIGGGYIAEVKDTWIYTSTPPHNFKAQGRPCSTSSPPSCGVRPYHEPSSRLDQCNRFKSCVITSQCANCIFLICVREWFMPSSLHGAMAVTYMPRCC